MSGKAGHGEDPARLTRHHSLPTILPALMLAFFHHRRQALDGADGAQDAVFQGDIMLLFKDNAHRIVPDILGGFPEGAQVLQAAVEFHRAAAQVHVAILSSPSVAASVLLSSCVGVASGGVAASGGGVATVVLGEPAVTGCSSAGPQTPAGSGVEGGANARYLSRSSSFLCSRASDCTRSVSSLPARARAGPWYSCTACCNCGTQRLQLLSLSSASLSRIFALCRARS